MAYAARASAQQELQLAKKTLAIEIEATRGQLERDSSMLATEIAAAILEGRPAGPNVPVGGNAR